MHTKVFVNVAFEPEPEHLATTEARTLNQACVLLLHTRMEGPLGPLSPPAYNLYSSFLVALSFSLLL